MDYDVTGRIPRFDMPKDKIKFSDIPKFPSARYEIDVGWDYLEEQLGKWTIYYSLNLDPEFQRAHVWSRRQQVAYVEYILSGGEVAKSITFNCPGWQLESIEGPMELIDGKQRLEAARAFWRGDLEVFGRFREDFIGHPRHYVGFKFRVCSLDTQLEVLELYLNINAGGTPHTPEELARVREIYSKLNSSERRT